MRMHQPKRVMLADEVSLRRLWRSVIVRALLDLAQAQLSPNGGGSLVDRVCAQGEALARIEGEQAHQGQAVVVYE